MSRRHSRRSLGRATIFLLSFAVLLSAALLWRASGPTEAAAALASEPLANPASAPAAGTSGQTETVLASAVISPPDLSVFKSAPAAGFAGSPIQYSIDVYNWGPGAADGVIITDTLPDPKSFIYGGWRSSTQKTYTASLAAGNLVLRPATALPANSYWDTLYISGTFSAGLAAGTAVTNYVAISSLATDANPFDNADSAVTIVNPPGADVKVGKFGPPTAATGTMVEYYFDVYNVGDADAAGVVITDTYPAGFKLGGWRSDFGRTYTVTPGPSQLVLWPTVSLPPQTWSWDRVRITGTFGSGITANTVVTNQVRIDTASSEPVKSNNASSATTVVGPPDADVSASISESSGYDSDGNPLLVAGRVATQWVYVYSRGNIPAEGVVLTVTLPPQFTLNGWRSSGNLVYTPTVAAGRLTLRAAAPLPAQLWGSDTIIISSAIAANITVDTDVTTRAEIGTTSPESNKGDNAASLVLTVPPAVADVMVEQRGPYSALAGSTTGFRFDVGNRGNTPAGGVAISVTLPGSFTLVDWSSEQGRSYAASRPAGQFLLVPTTIMPAGNQGYRWDTVLLTGTLSSAITQTTVVGGSADIATTTAEANRSNNSSTRFLVVSERPLVDLALWSSAPSRIATGQVVQYDVYLFNYGNVPATGAVISIALPSQLTFGGWRSNRGLTYAATRDANGLLLQPALPLANGLDSFLWDTIYVTGTYPSSITTATVFTSVVTVSASLPDDNLCNNSFSASTTVAPPYADLLVRKYGPATAAPGALVEYYLEVGNEGNADASGVVITDTLPANFMLGGWWSYRSRYGSPVYNAQMQNNRLILAANQPIGADYTSWDTIYVTGTFASGIADGTVVANQVEIGGGGDPNLANNTATVSTTLRGALSADIAVRKSGVTLSAPGGYASYRIDVLNPGNTAAEGVVITDTLPADFKYSSWFGSRGRSYTASRESGKLVLRPNAPVTPYSGATNQYGLSYGFLKDYWDTITVYGYFGTGFADTQAVVNRVDVTTSSAEVNTANNTATATTTVVLQGLGAADVGIRKTSPATALAGAPLTYTLVISNGGNIQPQAVAITDTFPAEFALRGWRSWYCMTYLPIQEPGRLTLWSLRPLYSSSYSSFYYWDTVYISGTISSGVNPGTTLVNQVSIDTASYEINKANNSTSSSTLIQAATSPTPVAGDPSEPDNSPAAAKPISADAPPQLHNVDSPGDQDWVSFDVTAGARYTILTADLGQNADTVLYLYASLADAQAGAPIASNDDAPGLGYGSRLDFTAGVGGLRAAATATYYVKVMHYLPSAAGAGTNYKLGVYHNTTPPGPATATPTATPAVPPTPTRAPDLPAHGRPADALNLAQGAIQHHYLSYAETESWFKFTANPNQRYVIRTYETADNLVAPVAPGTTYTVSAGLDTMLYLYGADVVNTWGSGTVVPIAFNDDWGGAFDPTASQIVWQAPFDTVPGTVFYVRVVNYDRLAVGYGTDFWIGVGPQQVGPTPTPTGTPPTATPTPAISPTPTMPPIRVVVDPATGQDISSSGVSVSIPPNFITSTFPVEINMYGRAAPAYEGVNEGFNTFAVKAVRTDTGERVAEFGKAAQVCLQYTADQLANRREDTLAIRVYNLRTQQWEALATTYWKKLADPAAPGAGIGVICANTLHFTDWALWAAAVPVIVADKIATPASGLLAASNQEVQFTVSVSNEADNGDVTGEVTRIEDLLPAGFGYVSGSNDGIGAPDVGSESGRTKLTWSGQWNLGGKGQNLTFRYRARVGSTTGSALSSDLRVSGNNFDLVNYNGAPLEVRAGAMGDFKIYLPMDRKQAEGGW